MGERVERRIRLRRWSSSTGSASAAAERTLRRPAADHRPAAAASFSTPPIPQTPDRPRARPSGTTTAAARPPPPCRRSAPAPRRRAVAGALLPRSSSRPGHSAGHRCRPGCCSAAGGGAAGGGAGAAGLAEDAIFDGGMSFMTGGLAARSIRDGSCGFLGLHRCRWRRSCSRLVGTWRRLGFVVGDDTPDRRQNLLHRGFLDLCRLRHLRLQIINALACVSLTPSATRFAGSGCARLMIFVAEPDLSPDHAHGNRHAVPSLLKDIETSRRLRRRATNRSAASLRLCHGN